MARPSDLLYGLLRLERLTAVVDVGANPIDGDPPYSKLLAQRLCNVVGFEPQTEALAALNARKSELETYLPYVIGDGRDATLRVCQAQGMTSLLESDPRVLTHFKGFMEWGMVVRQIPITTRRLDDVAEIAALDFLKVDAQGSELAVFRGGRNRLQSAVAIQTEVSFIPMYKQQPVFGDIDLELRESGFVPHTFATINKRMILPTFDVRNPYAAMNQMIEADIVYVRDFTQPDRMNNEQLKLLAMIAHHCYRSYDLAINCLHHLHRRGAIAANSAEQFINAVKVGG